MQHRMPVLAHISMGQQIFPLPPMVLKAYRTWSADRSECTQFRNHLESFVRRNNQDA